MDPYLWTWTARWGAACALAVAWVAVGAWEVRQGARLRGGVLLALGGATGAALATHLAPLLVRAPLPAEPWALGVAAALPFVAFAGLAATGPGPAPGRFDLAAVLPAALWPHGLPAWTFGLVLLGRGHLWGAGRRWLLAGLLGLAVATGAQANRGALAEQLPLGPDDAAHVVDLGGSGLEAAGWVAVTAWSRRGGELSRADR